MLSHRLAVLALVLAPFVGAPSYVAGAEPGNNAGETLDNSILNKAISEGVSLDVIFKQFENAGSNCRLDSSTEALIELQKSAKQGGWKTEDIAQLQKKVIDLAGRDRKKLEELVLRAVNVFVNSDPDEYDRMMRSLMSEGRRVIPFLLQQLDREDDRMRAGVVDALGRIGDKSEAVVRQVVLMLVDRAKPVRLQAAQAVAQLATKDTCELLATRLTNVNAKLDGVAMALGYLGDTRAIDPLAKLLRNSTDSDARVCAAFALGQLRARNSEASSALLDSVLDEHDAKLRKSAAHSLGLVHDPRASSYIMQAVRRYRDSRDELLKELTAFKEINVLDFLVEQFASDEPKVKRAAKEALMVLTGEEQEDVEGWKSLVDILRTRPDFKNGNTEPKIPDAKGNVPQKTSTGTDTLQTNAGQ